MNLLDSTLWLAVLAGMLRAATPVIYAAVGETINERSGVVNLGIEGLMLIGAYAAVTVQLAFGNSMIAIGCAGLLAALVGFLHATFCVKLRTNQVVTGLVFLFLCQGASALFGARMVGRPVNVDANSPFELLSRVPVVGDILARQDPMVFGAILAALIAGFILFRTRWGVVLRACGEDAESAAAAGVPVHRVRLIAGTVCGFLCGLGGAHLALFYARQWQENMTAGRGWVALVMVIFGKWVPGRVIAGAYLFGGLSALQLNLQASGIALPQYLLGMLPFVVTILLLVVASWWVKTRPDSMPKDLGKAFPRAEDLG
jgi:simple sugar transport system permease protein